MKGQQISRFSESILSSGQILCRFFLPVFLALSSYLPDKDQTIQE